MRFSRILLVLDSGDSHDLALRRTVALAQREGAMITVCEVIHSIPEDYGRAIVSVTVPELIGAVVSDKLERLRNLVKAIDSANLSIQFKVLVGKAHAEIAREVRDNGHDLVIKSIVGRRERRTFLARRADRRLIRNCPCPVWLVNTADQSNDACILVAIDRPEGGVGTSELTRQVLKAARSIDRTPFFEPR